MGTVPTMSETSDPIVSVVIATAERPDIVLTCLAGLAEQLPEGSEVLIVDAGPEEQRVDKGKARGVWSYSSVLRSSVRNAGTQRNMGARAAKGDIIVFLDDDTHLEWGEWGATLDT